MDIDMLIAFAETEAKKVLKKRNEILNKRPDNLKSPGGVTAMGVGTGLPTIERISNRKILIAEGDSWFDYPMCDILTCLDDQHGYEIESVAHAGDKIESMAYDTNQVKKIVSLFDKLKRYGGTPHAILLSGGGNDFAGKEFGMLLNHKKSKSSGINRGVLNAILNDRLKEAYIILIAQVTKACKDRFGQPVPIIIHGYAYPVPDGRGFFSGWGPLPGPWLEPGFREKGFEKLQERIDLVKELIDGFNDMLQKVAAIKNFGHVHYIDLRPELSNATAKNQYKNDWSDELHPTAAGFAKIAKRFANVIK